jgi:hypothetical protein
MVASLQPVAPPPPAAPEPDSTNPVMAAANLLDDGMRFLDERDFRKAARAFESAIETGRLNDAGRAFAYWQAFIAYQQLHDVNHSSEALSAFLVVATDVMIDRAERRYTLDLTGDFVDRFALDVKVRRARAMLSALWAARARHFGRSAMQPVPVKDALEIDEFLTLVSPCDSVERVARASQRLTNDTGETVQKISLTCGTPQRGIEFYFDVPER